METENNMLQYPMRYLESVLNIENSLTGKTINIRLSDSEDNNSFLTAGDNKVISGNQQSKVGFLNISYAAFIIMFLFVIYVTGVIVKTIFFISKVRKMKNLKDGSFHEKYNGFNLYITPQNIHPFCWGTSIYISEKDFDEKEESILIHETMHLKSRHTIDLIYFNILSNIFWFNPAISRLYSDLKLIHEFEADQAVLNNGINANKYQLLIVKKTVGARQFSLANSFGHSQLKARINMMLKEKTNGKAKLRVLIFAPAMIFMMYFFSGSAIASIMVTEQDKKSDKIEEKTDDGELVIFVPLSNEAIKGSKILFDVAGKKEPVELKDFSEKSFILKINEKIGRASCRERVLRLV